MPCKFSSIRHTYLLKGRQLNVSHIRSLRRCDEILSPIGSCTKATTTGHQQLRTIGRQQHTRGSPTGWNEAQRLICACVDHGHGVETQQGDIKALPFSIDRDAERQVSPVFIQPGISADRYMS